MRAQSPTSVFLYMHGMARGQTGSQYCSTHKAVADFMFARLGQMHTVPDAQERETAGDPVSVTPQLEDGQSSSSDNASAGDRDDDWWYSLSPHHRAAAAEPQRAGWRLRVRHLLHDQPLSHRFRERLEALQRYKERWGDMNVPRRFWEDWELGIWVTDLRAASRQQWLNPTQARCLREINFPVTVSGAIADWDNHFHELRRFQKECSCAGPDLRWRDPNADFANDFAKWYHQLPEHYAQHTLAPDQVEKLHRIGVTLVKGGAATLPRGDYAVEHQKLVETGSDTHFQAMYAQLCKFRQMYGTSLVPRQVFDSLSLGEWVHVLRRQGKKELLPAWKRECLDQVHFVWKVDQQTALWHYHLHEARRYKLAFGHARIPEDYHNKDQPGWVGAARWLTRNARQFAKGKLGDKRYELIRNILGIKFVKKTGGTPLRRDGEMLPHNVTTLGPWNRQHHRAT